jgi:predicted transcriptional regulator
MKDVLLGIKEQYAIQILRNVKTIELRKKIWNEDVEKVVLCHKNKAHGYFIIEKVVKIPEGYKQACQWWNTFGKRTMITRTQFLEYALTRQGVQCYAIFVQSTYTYLRPKELGEFGAKVTPQNFCYVKANTTKTGHTKILKPKDLFKE